MGLGIIGTILSQPMPRLVQRLAEFEAAKPETPPVQPQQAASELARTASGNGSVHFGIQPAWPYSQREYPNLNAAICRESDAEAEPSPGHTITAPHRTNWS